MAGPPVWWLALFLIGLLALPITVTLFSGLSDRAYAFSRPVGLIFVGYVFWVLGLGGLVSNTQTGVLTAVGVVGAVSAVVLVLRRRAVVDALRRRWGLVLATEALFAGLFTVWLGIRSYTPAIAHTEQPMDFMVLNSILRSPDFPPRDAWFAGQPLSYYYFGYFIAAFLTKLTGISSAVTYNLMLASTAAMAGTGVASIVFNVAKALGRTWRKRSNVGPMAAGVLAAALLLFASNLEGAVEYLRANRVGSEGLYEWTDVRGLRLNVTPEDRYPNAQEYPNVAPRDCAGCPGWLPTDTWWWFRATRVINTFRNGAQADPTITEFPFFSLLLGDLHPHVMSPPFVALALGLGLSILLGRRPEARWLWKRPGLLLLLALLLGSLGSLNTWDLPVFLGLVLTALALRACVGARRSLPGLALDIAVPAAAIVVGAVLLYLPFYVHLHSSVDGVSYLRRVMTRPLHFVLVWGPLAVLNLVLLGGLAWEVLRRPSVITARSQPRPDFAEPPVQVGGVPTVAGGAPDADEAAAHRSWVRTVAMAAALALLPFAAWAALELRAGVTGSRELLPRGMEAGIGASLAAVGSRFAHLLPLLLVVGLAVTLLLRLGRWSGPRRVGATRFALLVVLWGFLLTVGMELFRVVDSGGENRMNTVFKLSYQAWVLFSVGGGIGVYWLVGRAGGGAHRWGRKLALGGGLAVVLVPVFVYAPAALYDKSDHFAGPPTLDGLAGAANTDPMVLDAARWIRDHAPADSAIVEGVPRSERGRPGGDFRPDVGRVSQWSGVPTVLGWPYHEWLWRGDWEGIDARYQDIDATYRNNSPARVRQAMERYGVKYVVVGPLERRLYGKKVDERLGAFMGVAYRNAQVTVYTPR